MLTLNVRPIARVRAEHRSADRVELAVAVTIPSEQVCDIIGKRAELVRRVKACIPTRRILHHLRPGNAETSKLLRDGCEIVDGCATRGALRAFEKEAESLCVFDCDIDALTNVRGDGMSRATDEERLSAVPFAERLRVPDAPDFAGRLGEELFARRAQSLEKSFRTSSFGTSSRIDFLLASSFSFQRPSCAKPKISSQTSGPQGQASTRRWLEKPSDQIQIPAASGRVWKESSGSAAR